MTDNLFNVISEYDTFLLSLTIWSFPKQDYELIIHKKKIYGGEMPGILVSATKSVVKNG